MIEMIHGLRCEYLENPLGVDTAEPRFSWTLSSTTRGECQTAYQVLVASDPSVLESDTGDLWDSGIVESDCSIHIVYAGQALSSSRRYFWKVRAFDKLGRSSPWSSMASFQTGILHEQEWKAKWIAASDSGISAPLLRKEFCLDRPVKEAYAHISGLGYYELYIDGEKTGDRVLDPGTTEYSKRVLYSTYDVTDKLHEGNNAIGVVLGNGWFTPPWKGARQYASAPMLFVQLCVMFDDGSTQTIISDETWKASEGPIRFNSVFDGEIYDARLEKPGWCCSGYDDSGWSDARVCQGPGGVLDSQLMPAIKVTKTIEPVAVTNPKPGVYVFDMGQNFAGWSRLTIRRATDGAEVTMKYAERVGEDGLIDPRSLRKAKAADTYIARDGQEQIYEPRFTYHGFRYVQVEGYPGVPDTRDLQGRVVHTAVEQTGHFSCSNPLIERIHQNVLWSYVSNLHGIPTDCPQRDERLGWTGDAHLAAELGMTNFFSASFYTKWLEDVTDARLTTKFGGVPDLVPFHLAGFDEYPPGPPGWSAAHLFIVWYMYLYFEDRRVLESHYEGVRAWVDCVRKHCDEDYIVAWGRGDWAIPSTYEADDESKKVTSTSLLYTGAMLVSRMAGILDRHSDAASYAELADKVKEGFRRRLLDQSGRKCGSGTQTANLFPVYAGVISGAEADGVVRTAVDSIVQSGYHLDTGILGTKALVNVLPERGMADVLHKVVTQTTYPSFGYMVENGATTLWETFDGGLKTASVPSLNHIMFGTVDEYFFKDLAGIKPPTSPSTEAGFRRVTIKPYVPVDPKLTWVKASIMTVRGLLSSSWEKSEGEFRMDVSIPVGTSATVHVPLLDEDGPVILEGNSPVFRDGTFLPGVDGVERAYTKDGCVVFEVASGSYTFRLRTGQKCGRR